MINLISYHNLSNPLIIPLPQQVQTGYFCTHHMDQKKSVLNFKLQQLAKALEGELYDDLTMRILYATDASAYREMPLAVVVPKTVNDIKKLIAFAHAEQTSLIPRTAGTSLAGQVVGDGIIVDVSKYFIRLIGKIVSK